MLIHSLKKEKNSKLLILILFYLRSYFSLVYGGISILLKKNCGFLQENKEERAKKIGKHLFYFIFLPNLIHIVTLLADFCLCVLQTASCL